jgi:rhodanese-related sulfurtransferase
VRLSLITVTAAAALLLGASAAAPPDYPANYISVDELKTRLDRKERGIIIDVRTRPEFDALHIAGARSVPLRNMRERASEVPRSGLVVLY